MMSRKVCSNARWIWRKQAKVWRGSWPVGKAYALDREEVAPVGQELVVESPAARSGAGFRSEAGLVEFG